MIDVQKTKQINLAIRERRVGHPYFQKILESGKQLCRLPDLGMPGSGIIVHGPSGVGKTTLTNALVEHGQRHYCGDAVIRTQLTANATIKGVISSLLMAFGDPRPQSGTSQALMLRLQETISDRGCRLIIIDETQHLIPGGNPAKPTIDNILNAFKMLDETNVSIMLVGMSEIMAFWSADEQIRSRFQTPYLLQKLSYPKDQPMWKGICKKYVDTLNTNGMHVECSDFYDRLYAATSGAMRPLVSILMSAVVEATKRGSAVINAEDLRIATHMQVTEVDGRINAFDLSMQELRRVNGEARNTPMLAHQPPTLGSTLVS
jgi:Cdc6-like AAA superfamily ATPase